VSSVEKELRIQNIVDQEQWNNWISQFPENLFTHDWRWGSLCETVYRWKPYRLALLTLDPKCKGLVTFSAPPHFHTQKAVSMPFATASGLLGVNPEAQTQCFNVLGQSLSNFNLKELTLRQPDLNYSESEEYTFLFKTTNQEAVWKGLNQQLRHKIRKGEKVGLKVQKEPDSIEVFYKIYSKRMHEFGTPPHTIRFFELLQQLFPNEVQLWIARTKEGKAIGGILMILWKSKLYSLMPVALQEYNFTQVNALLYWKAITLACDLKMEGVDFGRSHKSSGTYTFKSRWGATPIPLKMITISKSGVSSSPRIAQYRSHKAKIISKIWSILPFPLVQHFGPLIRARLP
jgi:hypothetical protein